MEKKEKEALKKKLKEELKGKPVGEYKSYLQDLYKTTMELMLEGELDELLGYEKNKRAEDTTNRRNGSNTKRIQSRQGEYEIKVPRDRDGKFEPKLVPKRKRIIDEIEDKILLLYGKGLSTRDIEEAIKDIYNVEIDRTTISRITDRILPEIEKWQNRPLEKIYLVVWVDAIRVKIKENYKLKNKSIYIAIGLNTEGYKEILGIWVSEEESASYWLTVVTDMKSRGIEDILIISTDNLKGLTQVMEDCFEKSITQVCVIHQIRNTLRYITWTDKKEFIKQLKKIYEAPNREIAFKALEELKEQWYNKYPTPINSWYNNWEKLTNYFDFPVEIRKIIYTTNIIESFNRVVRKYIKNKTQFPSDKAAIKAVYLAAINMNKKWSTRPIPSSGMIINQFKHIFGDRFQN